MMLEVVSLVLEEEEMDVADHLVDLDQDLVEVGLADSQAVASVEALVEVV